MLSNTSEASAAVPPSRPDEAKRTAPPAANPRGVIIEVASNGTGSTNDGSGTDKPPGLCDPDDPADCF